MPNLDDIIGYARKTPEEVNNILNAYLRGDESQEDDSNEVKRGANAVVIKNDKISDVDLDDVTGNINEEVESDLDDALSELENL
jgi:hypothetical protein